MANQQQIADFKVIQKQMGLRIKWARELVEPSPPMFAKVLGVHRTTILKIEDGSRSPSLIMVFDISRRLRVTPDYILIGSLYGADPEIARMLLRRHPELNRLQSLRRYDKRQAPGADSNVQPMTPKRA